MAYRDLELFLRNLSKHPDFRAAFNKNKKKVMAEAGLSATEQALVLSGDRDAIRGYLGEKYGAAQQIEIP
jgi:hypothetical protein